LKDLHSVSLSHFTPPPGSKYTYYAPSRHFTPWWPRAPPLSCCRKFHGHRIRLPLASRWHQKQTLLPVGREEQARWEKVRHQEQREIAFLFKIARGERLLQHATHRETRNCLASTALFTSRGQRASGIRARTFISLETTGSEYNVS
jgi:hypothetical protein